MSRLATSTSEIGGAASPDTFRTQLQLTPDTTSDAGAILCHLKVSAVPNTTRPPVDIAMVIDVSGSMNAAAPMQNADGTEEKTGLTVLDITKHAVKTVMEVLGPNDRLSIVKYSDNAQVVTPLSFMTDAGKAKVNFALEAMHTEGCTNIWDGILKGMETLRTRPEDSASRMANVMLLTDGQPNREPPEGHIPALRQYLDSYPQFSCTINTYGFGYNLNSELLDEIANETNGSYAFIPDSGFVGTIFVNSISNVIATAATKAELSFEVNDQESVEIIDAVGSNTHLKPTSWGAKLEIGNLPYEQDRSFLLRVKRKGDRPLDGAITATLQYVPVGTTQTLSISSDAIFVPTEDSAEIRSQYCRGKFFEDVRYGISNRANAPARLAELTKCIEDAPTGPFLTALLEDVKGQVTMGLTREDYFQKWGKHFLLSLSRAHLLQQCLNFKDPGVQFYGGQLFNEVRDEADDAFNKLPPPKPSGIQQGARAVASMASYNNCYGGCFDGEGNVAMFDGTVRQVKDLKKGDVILTRNGEMTRIVCIVRTTMRDGTCPMVELKNGVKLTPWHPVHVDGEWKFPNDLGTLSDHAMPYIYNAVVDRGHALNINGIDCVTLGHHLKENKVVEHAYFGTDAVLSDLKQMQGWNDGYICTTEGGMVRDPVTGLVTGWNQV